MLCFSANVVPDFRRVDRARGLSAVDVRGLPALVGVVWRLRTRSPDLFPRARRQMLVPLGGVLVGFLVFYFFRLIPPVRSRSRSSDLSRGRRRRRIPIA